MSTAVAGPGHDRIRQNAPSRTRLDRAYARFDRVTATAAQWLVANSATLLRLSIGAVFLGFGVLKFVPNLSPAADLAGRTFNELTFGLVPENVGLVIVAALESVIGLSLLTGRFVRVGLVLLGVAMVGILSPIVLLPEALFRGAVWAPTLAGQYVLKDVVLLAATLALAGSAFSRRMT